MSLRERLKRARKRLWELIAKRHDAKPGGDRRKKLAKEVREARERKDKLLEKLEDRQSAPKDDVGVFDGKPVAAWIIPWLERSRRAGWQGYVVSGYRSPEYSESICIAMCGAPTCPGRCAGRGSGHSQKDYPGGCVDVDLAHYAQFEAIQFRIGSPLRNNLPNDPNHFSVSGT